jgi:AraC family transcriptional regulator
MPYSITTRHLSPQPVLFITRRVKQAEIANAIGEALPLVFEHAQKSGATIVGPPFARYPEMGPGLMTLEIGVPVGAPPGASGSEVEVGNLPGGLAAVTMHIGPYDKLPEAITAMGTWIQEQCLTPAGGPWESYVTDPGNYPDPKDWKTEVVWPVLSNAGKS